MMLHFPDPSKLKTKKIVFEDIYPARDSGTLEQLKELSSKRRVVEESINESRFITEAIAREISGGLTSHYEQDVQKLELYLPLLENLVCYVDLIGDNPQLVRWTSGLKIRWSSALTTPSLFNLKVMGLKFYQVDNLRFELCMILFLYGAMIREWASEVLSTDLVKSVTLFRKAAGVYHYLAHEVLPSLQPALVPERPIEATSSVSSIMSLICLAEAQAATIKKAEEKGNTGGLMAKLHYGVTQLLDEAIGSLSLVTKECKDLSLRLVDFMLSYKTLHELRSYKYLADGLKNGSQIGSAVGVLRHGLTTAQKNMPGEELWRVVIMHEIEDCSRLLKKFEHENEFVWHEKIPDFDQLPVAEGVKIATPIPYQPQKWERPLAFKI